MLDNFDTGYEGKYDFAPRREPPQQTYLLASIPRAGSTYLSHLLWRTGQLGAPLEYLNFEPEGPYGFAATSVDLQLELWHSVVRRRCSPNGVFGLKAFPQQLEMLQRSSQPLLAEVLATILPKDKPRRVIYLRRRDRVAQVVSYARASMSGVWRKDQESATQMPLEYSQATLEAAERGIELQERVWAKMFEDLAIEPLHLWHEDVISDPRRAAHEASAYIGAASDGSPPPNIPVISKQSPGNSAEWARRYAMDAPNRVQSSNS